MWHTCRQIISRYFFLPQPQPFNKCAVGEAGFTVIFFKQAEHILLSFEQVSQIQEMLFNMTP